MSILCLKHSNKNFNCHFIFFFNSSCLLFLLSSRFSLFLTSKHSFLWALWALSERLFLVDAGCLSYLREHKISCKKLYSKVLSSSDPSAWRFFLLTCIVILWTLKLGGGSLEGSSIQTPILTKWMIQRALSLNVRQGVGGKPRENGQAASLLALRI